MSRTVTTVPIGHLFAELLKLGADIEDATADNYGTVEVLGHFVHADRNGQLNVSARGEDGYAAEAGVVTRDVAAVAAYIWEHTTARVRSLPPNGPGSLALIEIAGDDPSGQHLDYGLARRRPGPQRASATPLARSPSGRPPAPAAEPASESASWASSCSPGAPPEGRCVIYQVTWTIDVFDATSHRAAAEQAYATMRSADPENLAGVFEITDQDDIRHTVDLSPGRHRDEDLSTDL
jgi:hypothetical protein